MKPPVQPEIPGILGEAPDTRDEWWWKPALAALRNEAQSGREFDSYTLTEVYGIDQPDSPARWGALFRKAHADGIIEHAGVTASRRPSRAGGLVRTWRGARPQ